jgi:hypothetical protein
VGFLDDIASDALGNLFTGGRTDKKLERLGQEGELVPATIYAIRVVTRSDSADEWTYGLDLVTSAGPLRASVRQQPRPDQWRAMLGAHVLARHLDGKVAMDWPATLNEAGVHHDTTLLAGKTLKTTLEPGIDDDRINRKRLRDGVRTEAEILAREDVEVMGMPTENRRLELRLDDGDGPRTVVLKREFVPPYADTLAQVGARVPVAVDPGRPDRVTIDWPSAAEQAAAGLG